MVYLIIKELSPSADEVTYSHAIYITCEIHVNACVLQITFWLFHFKIFFYKVIIVTSSLMKDMNSKTDMYRANAIRVLCRITDGTLLTQIERYLKQAIVDKNPVVASAALVSGIHLLQVVLISICNSLYLYISSTAGTYCLSPTCRQILKL